MNGPLDGLYAELLAERYGTTNRDRVRTADTPAAVARRQAVLNDALDDHIAPVVPIRARRAA